MSARLLSLLLLGAALLASPAAAQGTGTPQKLADGNAWMKSSEDERRAYLVGLSNAISVGAQYDEKKLPGQEGTFSRKARAGLGATSIEAAAASVTAWYRANPGELDKPVVSVLWREHAKAARPSQ